jgi:hypothetical protein
MKSCDSHLCLRVGRQGNGWTLRYGRGRRHCLCVGVARKLCVSEVYSPVVETAALVGAADAIFTATDGLAGLRSSRSDLQRWSAYARCEYQRRVPLTCVLGPDIHCRKPPEGKRGKVGISASWKFCNDDDLSGKM